MITFPNAKINIGLNIVEKRADGYHNIETIFYPIPIKDALEFIPSKNDKTTFTQTGIQVECEAEKNLVMKMLRLVEKDYKIPALDIILQKNIPFGAGMGGGSADAAFMLKMLNENFSLNLTEIQMMDYCSKIGADCAFFIKNNPVFATGIGNIFKEYKLSLKGYHIVVIKPEIHVSTPLAYSLVTPKKPKIELTELLKLPIEEWKNNVFNDFEFSVFDKFPEIKQIKEKLYEIGAVYASMSGSGSSVFGIFKSKIDIPTDLKKYYNFIGILD